MKFLTSSVLVALSLAVRSASAFVPPHVTSAAAISSTAKFATKADKLPIMAEEAVMSPKAHGTSEKPVQEKLRWNCDFQTADRICNFNRYVH